MNRLKLKETLCGKFNKAKDYMTTNYCQSTCNACDRIYNNRE